MKRSLTLLSLVLLAALIPAACSNNPYVPAPGLVTISVNGSLFRYSTGGPSGAAISSPLSLSAGQTVVWDTSNNASHPLYLYDGGTCLENGTTSFPVTHVMAASTTYNFHCGNHANGCSPGNTTCAATSCTAMAASITIP